MHSTTYVGQHYSRIIVLGLALPAPLACRLNLSLIQLLEAASSALEVGLL